MTYWKGFCLFISLYLVNIHASAARGAGLYEDPAGLSSFLQSARIPSLSSSMTYAEDVDGKAYLNTLNANYPLKTRLFLQLEQPYITVSKGQQITSGFGDFRLRLRCDLISQPGFRLHFLGGLRSGSGTRLVYPYASGSIDSQAGLAVVDTLASMTWWGALSGTTVWRGPEKLDRRHAHANYLALHIGLVLPVRSRLDLGFSGSGFVLQTGAARELYSVQLVYRPAGAVNFFGSLMAEGGKPEERVDDFSVVAGVRVFYD